MGALRQPAWSLANKVLQRTKAAARATRSLWPSPLNTGTLGRFGMATDLQNLNRKVRFWSVVAVASLVGLRLAVDLYGGPSIGLGISIAFGFGIAIGLLSICFGERFWRLVRYLRFFFF